MVGCHIFNKIDQHVQEIFGCKKVFGGCCSELVIYHILPINQVLTSRASSMILYISSNHNPILEGIHYVHKHTHIVIEQIYIDT